MQDMSNVKPMEFKEELAQYMSTRYNYNYEFIEDSVRRYINKLTLDEDEQFVVSKYCSIYAMDLAGYNSYWSKSKNESKSS